MESREGGRTSNGPTDLESRLLQALAEAVVIDEPTAGPGVHVWSVMSALDRISFLVVPRAELRGFRPTGTEVAWEALLLRRELLARFRQATEGRFVRLSELAPRMAVDTGFHVFDVRLGEAVEVPACVLIPRRAFEALGPQLMEKVTRREGVRGPAYSSHPIRHTWLRVPAGDLPEVLDHGHGQPSGKTWVFTESDNPERSSG